MWSSCVRLPVAHHWGAVGREREAWGTEEAGAHGPMDRDGFRLRQRPEVHKALSTSHAILKHCLQARPTRTLQKCGCEGERFRCLDMVIIRQLAILYFVITLSEHQVYARGGTRRRPQRHQSRSPFQLLLRPQAGQSRPAISYTGRRTGISLTQTSAPENEPARFAEELGRIFSSL